MRTTVATKLMAQKGAAGMCPSRAPRRATPAGTHTAHAGRGARAACLTEAVARFEYAPRAGDKMNHERMKGRAVVNALPSTEP